MRAQAAGRGGVGHRLLHQDSRPFYRADWDGLRNGGAYAVQPAYGIGFAKDVYPWIPVLGNILAVAVIPFVGNLSDRIGRRPPVIAGALGA